MAVSLTQYTAAPYVCYLIFKVRCHENCLWPDFQTSLQSLRIRIFPRLSAVPFPVVFSKIPFFKNTHQSSDANSDPQLVAQLFIVL